MKTPWRVRNKKRHREYNRKWYVKNKAKKLAKAKTWRKANKEKHKKLMRDWYKKNKLKIKKYGQQWEKKNRLQAVVRKARRRTLERSAKGCFTSDDVKNILKRQKNKCPACKKNISKKYHVDHVMPLSKGGSSWPKNLQLLCPPCNFTKKDMHPKDFERYIRENR